MIVYLNLFEYQKKNVFYGFPENDSQQNYQFLILTSQNNFLFFVYRVNKLIQSFTNKLKLISRFPSPSNCSDLKILPAILVYLVNRVLRNCNKRFHYRRNNIWPNKMLPTLQLNNRMLSIRDKMYHHIWASLPLECHNIMVWHHRGVCIRPIWYRNRINSRDDHWHRRNRELKINHIRFVFWTFYLKENDLGLCGIVNSICCKLFSRSNKVNRTRSINLYILYFVN